MEIENSLLSSKELVKEPYPEPEEFSPPPPILSLRSILIFSYHIRVGLLKNLFQISPLKFCILSLLSQA